jgi:ketosteroid isomerase-like protein
MSENLDLVRSIYADWGRGDFGSVGWADPEIEWVQVGGPDPATVTGLVGMAHLNREFLSAWHDWRVEAEEVRELDGERVLVLTRRGGRGKASGLEVFEPSANVLHVRDGKVVRLVFYWDRDRALGELGMTE